MFRPALMLLTATSLLAAQPAAYAQGFSLFQGNSSGQQNRQIVQVQAPAGDTSGGVMQLQEQVRNLTGQIEDMNFQLLQMEEKIRKMQEDMEFRLQDIESGSGAAPSSSSSSATQAPPPPSTSNSTAGQAQAPATPPPEAPLPAAAEGNGDDAAFYKTAYNLILSGDYPQAEQAFGEFVLSYPDSPLISDASFWLGESMLAQQKYNDAARTFLNAYKAYGDSNKAPEMLLKLGQSLAGLDNNDAACATFSEVPVRYPNAGAAVLNKAKSEMATLGCS